MTDPAVVTTSLAMGAYILGSIAGLLGPKQNIQQVTTKVTNILTTTFTNEVNALIQSNTALQIINRNRVDITASGNCSVNVTNFTQAINSVAGINKVLDQQTYTRFINETMAKFTNNLTSEITRQGSSLDAIFTAIAQLLGYQSQQQVKTEVVNQFTSIVRNLYNSNLETNTRITIDNSNTVVIRCLDNSSIVLDGTLQNIVQNSIVSERITQINSGVSESRLVLDVYTKSRSSIVESSIWTWLFIIIGILLFLFLIGLGVYFFMGRSQTVVTTIPQTIKLSQPPTTPTVVPPITGLSGKSTTDVAMDLLPLLMKK